MKNLRKAKNTKRYRLISFFLAVTLGCVGFISACTFWGSEPTSTKTTQPPIAEVPTLKIVGLFPMTGPAAAGGEYLRNGVDIAKNEVEKRFAGKLKLQVDILDSKNQPKEGISALQASFTTGNPDVVISGLSSVSKAIIPLVEQKQVLTIATATALTDLPKGTKTVVRVYPTSQDFVETVADYMLGKFDNVGVLYVNDDFGRSNLKVFTTKAELAGKKSLLAEPFELLQKDMRPTISKILSSSPQAIFVTGYGPAFTTTFKQIKEVDKNIPLFTEIGFANPAVIGTLGKDADGIIFNGTDVELSQPETSVVKEFQQLYKNKYKTEPYMVAGFAHDSVVMLAEAAMKTGTFKKPDKRDLISLSPFQGIMGKINLDNNGESRISLKLMRRENGVTLVLP